MQPIHCPKCKTIVAKNLHMQGEASFVTRCGGCKTMLKVSVAVEQRVKVEEAVKVSFVPEKV